MLVVCPSTYRKRPHKVRPATPPPPPAGPTLTGASFESGGGLTLFFDPDVLLVAFDPSGIVVNDPDTESTYVATAGATVVSGFIVTVPTTATGPAVGAGRTLTAGTTTGIVSAVTGGPWAGVVDFPLDPASSAETDGEGGAA